MQNTDKINKASDLIQEKKLNKLLLRQMKRKLGKDVPINDEMMEFLSAISDSYNHYEKDRILLERSMDLSSQELRKSYGQLAIQNELKRTNDELNQFVSIASHDLKAPLRTINSFVQLLERKLKSQLDECSQEYMDFIKSGVHGMDELIQNLLQHAKASSNKGTVEVVNLNKTIEIAEQNLHALIKESNGQIIIDDSLPYIDAVSFQVVQLFQNIIGNGLKFKKENVDSVIRIKCNEEENHFLISIADNGIGIAMEDTSKIFEVFQRLKGASHYEGTGLGLSICKKIVENLNGKIWLESEVGVGTTFLFTIPKEIVVESSHQILKQKMLN